MKISKKRSFKLVAILLLFTLAANLAPTNQAEACDQIVNVVKYKDRFCLFGGWRCIVEKDKCLGNAD